jgi:hypothetical protein
LGTFPTKEVRDLLLPLLPAAGPWAKGPETATGVRRPLLGGWGLAAPLPRPLPRMATGLTGSGAGGVLRRVPAATFGTNFVLETPLLDVSPSIDLTWVSANVPFRICVS